jgi:plasmid stability protein
VTEQLRCLYLRVFGSVLIKAKNALQGHISFSQHDLKNAIIFVNVISLQNMDWSGSMAAVTIRNISDETHRALRARAAHHGRSTEAEIRDILEAAVRPSGRVKLGSLLAAIGRDAELSNSDVEALQQKRDGTPAEPMTFE